MPGEDNPYDAIANLTRMLTSADPGPRNFISTASPDQAFVMGSAALPLQRRMHLDSSGLYVPPSAVRSVNPLDQVKVFITPLELTGVTLSVPDIARLISQVPLEHAVGWASQITARMNQPGADPLQVQLDYVEQYFGPELKVRAQNLLRDPTNVLLVPQALLVLLKLAFAVSEPCHEPNRQVDLAPLIAALIHIPAHLDAEIEGREEARFVVGKDPGALECYFIANQMFNASLDEKTAWAAFHRCWTELPVELADHPRVLDLRAAYLEATGVPLDDLVTVCAVLWAQAAGGQPAININHLDPLAWASDRIEAVLTLIAADAAQFKQMLADDVESSGMVWSTKTFEQYPVVRFDDGNMAVLDADLLIRRASGMWPLYDILRELEARGDKKTAGRVHGCVNHLYEEFARETLAGITGSDRLYTEDDLKVAYGSSLSVADAAADYGHAWVVADVTTTGFKLTTAAGNSAESVSRDLDNVVTKARQIESTINSIRADEKRLTKKEQLRGRRRFYPVLIIATRFAASPVTMTMLRERLAEAGVLQAEDVEQLEVMELQDLLAIEGAVEVEGLDMLAILTEKATASMAMMSIRHFLRVKLGHNAPYPRRIQDRWETWFQPAIAELRANVA